ncbi:MAG: acyl-CoA dehydrogenase family protein [Bdellovibrionales bacterium]|nr:acyl-CoA dehydrogenase family protein [Bdellovibrionales bacterium]
MAETQDAKLPPEDSRSAELDVEASAAKSLFLGEIVEENLFPFPALHPEEAETVRIILESIDKFMQGREEEFREFDKVGAQPPEYIQSLKELGLFGLVVPEEYGGLGLSSCAYSRVLQQTSRYDASTSLTIGAHSSIGIKGVILFGTDEQKRHYLPRLASGEMIGAFCLTEPGSGSDAASVSTHAEKQDDGTWRLSGEKIWITNGPIADFYTVFARTDSEKGKISAFLVERAWDGVSVGNKEDKLGIRASATSSVMFDNVLVPAENLLGEEGKGFKIAMNILNNGRTGLGGGCIGGMKTSIALASEYATQRKQFGQSISEFGLIKQKVAQMTIDCFAAESAVSLLGHYIDNGVKDFSVEAAICKVFATEAMWRTGNEALQIAGGNGFMKDYPYEMIIRDSRINMIYEGTNEILRLYIALSGLKQVGEYLQDLSESVTGIFNHPIKGFGVMSEYASKRITRLTSLGRDKVDFIPPSLTDAALVFEHYTLALERAAEMVLRRHGKKVIEKQFAMSRIANVVIDLFVGLAVLSRVSKLIEERGSESCVNEIAIANTFSQQAKRRMNQNLRRIEKNEDEDMKVLADHIFENGSFDWDTID